MELLVDGQQIMAQVQNNCKHVLDARGESCNTVGAIIGSERELRLYSCNQHPATQSVIEGQPQSHRDVCAAPLLGVNLAGRMGGQVSGLICEEVRGSITMELYIIRHAQSTNNALADVGERVCDPTLTELGERQADYLGRHLATGSELVPPASSTNGRDPQPYRFARVYCSPMWRALQTAVPIKRALGLSPQVWTDIHEQGGIFLDHGDGRGPVGYPGKTRREIQSMFPDYVLPAEVTARGWWNRDYEDWSTCHERAVRVAEELRQWAATDERADDSIAIVSHGGFIDALLKALFNQPPEGQLFYYHYNTAISRIDFRLDGRLDVRYLNRLDHLPPGLIS